MIGIWIAIVLTIALLVVLGIITFSYFFQGLKERSIIMIIQGVLIFFVIGGYVFTMIGELKTNTYTVKMVLVDENEVFQSVDTTVSPITTIYFIEDDKHHAYIAQTISDEEDYKVGDHFKLHTFEFRKKFNSIMIHSNIDKTNSNST